MAPQNQPFTPFTDLPNTSSFMSAVSSLFADGPTSSIPPFPTTAVSEPAATTSRALTMTAFSAPSSVPSSLSMSLTASTITSASHTESRATASSSSSSSSGSTATAAVSTSDAAVSASTGCHRVSCSPGLQAAVAVPVIVVVLAFLAFAIFLFRRRKRNAPALLSSEEKPRKTWTRHLRIFSFDNELLMGGRFSSSNSMRSGPSTHQVGETSPQRADPSAQSIEDVAPSYRDAVGNVQRPNMIEAGASVAAGAAAAAAIPRSDSRTSAPPPYGPSESRPQSVVPSNEQPASRNPFSDPHPTILVDGVSPFRDVSDDESSTRGRPGLSRHSSIHSGVDDGNSILNESDAGSIREAQLGRHMSIASGGRTITQIRHSQSPTSSDSHVST